MTTAQLIAAAHNELESVDQFKLLRIVNELSKRLGPFEFVNFMDSLYANHK